MDAGNAQMTDEDAAKAFEKVGGPAYPCQWSLPEGGHLNCPGMTLRDYFAVHADIGLLDLERIASTVFAKEMPANTADTAAMLRFGAKVQAALRYQMADVMLVERAKGGAGN